MSIHHNEPNDIVLGTMDERISITFSQYGFVQPQLTYHNETDAVGGGTYIHDQVVIEESILGRLVTVVLDDKLDVERRTLTVLIPRVLLIEDQHGGVEVTTMAIFTTFRESRAHRGQMQHYEVVEVQGTASRVNETSAHASES